MTPTAMLLLPIAASFIGLSIRDIARDMHGLRARARHMHPLRTPGTRARQT